MNKRLPWERITVVNVVLTVNAIITIRTETGVTITAVNTGSSVLTRFRVTDVILS